MSQAKRFVSEGSIVTVTRGTHVGAVGEVLRLYTKWSPSGKRVLFRRALLSLPTGGEVWVTYEHCEEV